MPISITSWQELAEHSFFHALTASTIEEIGLRPKTGTDFPALTRAINTMGPRPPYSYGSVIAGREELLKKHLEGNLSDEHDF